MFDRHTQPASPLRQTYIERLHAHLALTASLRESLLETLARPDAPEVLHGWITDVMEQNRLQARYITHILRHDYKEKPRDEHETVSHVLDVMVSSFPTGEAPLHILSVILNLAGDVARRRASLALLLLLAEKLSLSEDVAQFSHFRSQSRDSTDKLKQALPALLDHLG